MSDANFDLYKLLVEEVREARRARRELSNGFLTLNMAGVGALGFLAQGEVERFSDFGLLFWLCIALIFTAWIWRTSNKYYTRLLSAKYEVLYAVEKSMEHILGGRPVATEWEKVRGHKPDRRFFSLEYAMPMLFIFGYIVLLCYQISLDEVIALARSLWAPMASVIGGVGR